MRSTVRFLLNGDIVEVSNIDPATTALQWLRDHRRMTGTKEGCAEGDCGACTIMVGEGAGDRIDYRSINACIALFAGLDGKAVRTVEGLAGPRGQLHPAQEAMVARHASQCGFCTPGFVMSLATLYTSDAEAMSDLGINAWLSGNLCRCTGYGPIGAAARDLLDVPAPDWLAAREAHDLSMLAQLDTGGTLRLEGAGRCYIAPQSEDELAALAFEHPDARIVAGTTDVGLWITKQGRPPRMMLATGAITDGTMVQTTQLSDPARAEGARWDVFIGAAVTHADADRWLADPVLGELWRRFAGAQVRSAGTVGGNIANASPIGDLAPALIALDATLHLRLGPERRRVALEDFFIAYGKQDRRPGEIVTGVSFPRTGLASLAVHKVSKRFDDDISAVCGAFNITLEGEAVTSVRIAYGGMAATPKRAHRMEVALRGQPWTRQTVEAAMAEIGNDFQPISDMRASAAYRLEVAANLLLRTFLERSATASDTRLVGADAAFGA